MIKWDFSFLAEADLSRRSHLGVTEFVTSIAAMN
jgi:hypothetical protein